MRPRIVGDALQKIAQEPDIARAMFEILETQRILDSKAEITLVPPRSGVLGDLVAVGGAHGAPRELLPRETASPPSARVMRDDSQR
jgi:hypothetical protein